MIFDRAQSIKDRGPINLLHIGADYLDPLDPNPHRQPEIKQIAVYVLFPYIRPATFNPKIT